MTQRKLIAALAAVSVAAMAGGAFASNDGKDQAEVQAFLGAPQTLTAAIKAAETASNGTAVKAEFDDHKGTPAYEVDTIAGGKQITVKIDAASGAVLKTEDEGDIAKAEADDITDPALLGAPLAELVAKAEQAGQGKVMSIGAEVDDGKTPVVEVELANADGSTQDFTIAPDGTLTKATDHHDDGEHGDHDGDHGGDSEDAG